MPMMRKPHFNSAFALILIAGLVPAAYARQDQGAQPIPAYHSPLASAAGDAQDADTQTLAPDTNALTGAQNFSIGVPIGTHSYWQPSFNFATSADSNGLQASGNTNWTSLNSISAGLKIHRQSGTSDMDINYLAGGLISSGSGSNNGLIQGLSFKEKLTFRRSALSFIDAFDYLPQSQFGFAGLGGLQLPGNGAIGGNFAPGQTVLTQGGNNLTNSFVTEFDESLTARTSLTFVGGYSLLHSTGSNLYDYHNGTFQGGYNHQMSPKNTIGLSYAFSALRYGNVDQSIETNTVAASFGRRVTGRLGFQVSGGPQIVFSNLPITGNPAPTATSSGAEFYWSIQSSLQYQMGNTGIGATYSHGVNGGAGVLPGSLADTVSGSVNQPLTRTTNVSLSFGYSHNSGINQTTPAPTNQSFNSTFGSVTLNRALGPMLNLNLSYQAQYQTSGGTTCVGPACGVTGLRNLITLGVGWQRRPTPFE
jgi:hypothetical protein